MNKKLFSISMFFLGLIFVSCNNLDKSQPINKGLKSEEEIEKEKVLKIGQEIAFREYGDVIKNELPLVAKLVGDSVWIIEGTLQMGADGGTVYIEIRNGDNRVLKITHYK